MQKVIGITGGTGCGKTTALQVLRELGVQSIDCDALYHQLLETDTEMVRTIAGLFPEAVTEGVLNRKILGKLVFADPKALETLNQTVWPFVIAAVERQLRACAPQTCAIDAIGLFESGLNRLCTHTAAITASESMRLQRLMKRENISEDYALSRIRAQKTNEDFAALCGYTIENNGSEQDFRSRCHTIFQTILKEEPHL